MKLFQWCLVVCCVLITFGCKDNKANHDKGFIPPEEEGLELPMPKVPETLTGREEKLSFITNHFWDELNFNDTIKSNNEDFMAQNFANFVYILSLQNDSSAIANSVNNFFIKASVNSVAFERALDISRDYLSNPNSPMRNEGIWIIFLDVLKQLPGNSEVDKQLFSEELKLTLKNRPGNKASNFEYITSKNSGKTHLYDTKPGSEGILLIFYDPDCESCKMILEDLSLNSTLQYLINHNAVRVLAIDAEDDRKRWEETYKSLPQNWITGFNTDAILDRDIYVNTASPTIYILNPEFKVIIKDATTAQVDQWMRSIRSNYH